MSALQEAFYGGIGLGLIIAYVLYKSMMILRSIMSDKSKKNTPQKPPFPRALDKRDYKNYYLSELYLKNDKMRMVNFNAVTVRGLVGDCNE